jgi:hypothetical protein
MNFPIEPTCHILPNADLTPEQQIIAGEFANELITLGQSYRQCSLILPSYGWAACRTANSSQYEVGTPKMKPLKAT